MDIREIMGIIIVKTYKYGGLLLSTRAENVGEKTRECSEWTQGAEEIRDQTRDTD